MRAFLRIVLVGALYTAGVTLVKTAADMAAPGDCYACRWGDLAREQDLVRK